MKARVYLRVARTSRGFKFAATGKPSTTPLLNGSEVLPTIAFGLDLDLPVGAFHVPIVGQVDVPMVALHPCIDVELVEEPAP